MNALAIFFIILTPAFLAVSVWLFVKASERQNASYVTPLTDARQPLAVTLDAEGVYVVYIEVVQGIHLFSRWRYLLWDIANQAYIESRWAPNRKFFGTYAQRWRVRYFDVPHAGAYQLVVDGLDANDELKVIVGRYETVPLLLQTLGILAILATAFAFFAFVVSR